MRAAVALERTSFHLAYVVALSIAIAFVAPVVSVATFIIVAAMWFVPDRRLEGRPGTLSE